MCLSTVYRNSESEENLIAKYVAAVEVDNDKICLRDVMGSGIELVGRILKVDLGESKIIIATDSQ